MENKVINEIYDKNTGYSEVTIQNKYGRFTGTAQCHPNDLKSYSAYTGARYAEIRATCNYAKFRYNQEKIKLKAIKDFKKQLLNNNIFIDKKIERQLNLKIRDYTQSTSDWENLYKYLNRRIPELDKEREKILSRTKQNN